MLPPRSTAPATPYALEKLLSLLLIPISIAVIAARGYLDVPAPLSDPLLLSALNITFLTIIPLYIAYVSLVSFRFGGAVSTLLLGAGMLFVGLGSLATATAQIFPGTANMSVTIYNITVGFGMALSLAGPLTALAVWREPSAPRRRMLALAAYGGAVAVTAAVVLAVLLGLTPPFFVPGTGSTAVRDIVLALAIAAALLAAVLFFVLYRKRREDFFFWYGAGLALFGVGLITVAFIAVFGGLLNLVGRLEQYAGACYILAAFVILQRRASSQNITAREMLAAFFAEAEAGYRQLVETAGDAIVVLGPDDRVILWNVAAERMFGYTRDEADGLSFATFLRGGADVLNPADGDGSVPESSVRQQLEARHRDGRIFPVELTASRRMVEGRRTTTCILRDLSEGQRTEAALRESEAKYRNLVELSPDAILIHVDGAIVFANQAAAALVGAGRPEDLIGRPVLGIVHPGAWERVESNIGMDLQGEESPATTLDLLRDDGTTVPVQGRGARIPFGGRPAVQVVLRDVTEEQRAGAALRAYADDLKRSNEDLERFAYVSSHDLQEPLRAIVSFSQLLERRYKGRLGEDADEYIGFIVEGGVRMQTLIQDLLAFSRVNTTRQDLRPTDTEDVMAAVERNLALPLREAGAVLTHDSLPVVLADPLQLEQVFTNLVSNAVKFRRDDVPLLVHVGARRTDGFWEFSVSDNGIGIEPEYFDRIFTIFQRLHTKDAYPGTGIGLAIVKRIVERHGGRVGVESVPGEGSTFLFTLPAA